MKIISKRDVFWFRGVKYAEELVQQHGIKYAINDFTVACSGSELREFDYGMLDYFEHYKTRIMGNENH